MPKETKTPVEDTQPAKDLLTRLAHKALPNIGRINAAADRLVDAFVCLGGVPGVIEIAEPNESQTHRYVDFRVLPTGTEVTVRYAYAKQVFDVVRDNRPTQVQLAYDPVSDAFVSPAASRDPSRPTPTALELLIRQAWDRASESNEMDPVFAVRSGR